MPVYPDEINKVAREPKNARELSAAAARSAAASFECGCVVRFQLVETEGTITIAYTTNGCGYLIAVAESIAAYLNVRCLSELHGLSDDSLTNVVTQRIDQPYPNDRQHCFRVVLEGVHAVFANLREARLSGSPDEALICTCFGVSEETIEKAIKTHEPKSVEEVTRLTRAGGGCGACRMLIEEILDTAKHNSGML